MALVLNIFLLSLGLGLVLICFVDVAQCQLLRSENLGTYNPEKKKYDKQEIGSDDHDLKPHHKMILGGDDHDYIPLNKKVIGGGDHDYMPHSKKVIGGGDQDYKPHSKKVIGGDDHDYKPHSKKVIGGDDHDYKPHSKNIIGGGDHDYKPHSKMVIGGGDHDYIHHSKKYIGGGDHGYKPHNKKYIGGGDHDYKPHNKKYIGEGDHDYKPHYKKYIGGGDHDYKPHNKKYIGGGDHDYKPHNKKYIGGGDHDYKPHYKKYNGGGDHDYKPHNKKYIGGGDHDYKPHNKAIIGGGDHDYKPHSKKMLGKGADDFLAHPNMKHFKKNTKHLKLIGVFHDFVKNYNRTYENHKEFMKRYNVFRRNMKKITTLQLNEKGTAKYGITKFADMSAYEFRTLLGLKPQLKPATSLLKPAVVPDVEPPAEFDWRDKNVVTPVKNQGMCGSCWAFSVTGNVEGQWALKHNKLFSLSEQELVDCDNTDQGCNGGMPENAYKAIEDLGGLETETGYPYEAKNDKCQLDSKKIKVQVNGSLEIPQDEELMKKWLYKNGPISIGINANALQFYMGGVSHPFRFLCSPDDLDHGMLIVGYGVHTYPLFNKTLPFWIVKNSWGEKWGEQGYYRVFRGDGTCGVNKMATSAVVP